MWSNILRDPIWQFVGVIVSILSTLITLIALANPLFAGIVFIITLFIFLLLLLHPKRLLLTDKNKTFTSATDINQETADIVITSAFQRQRLKEQRLQAYEQENKLKLKKRIRIFSSIAFATLSASSLITFIFLQLAPQINFINSDNDYGSRVTSIAWSPNGKRVASVTQDGSVRVWEIAGGASLLVYPPQDQNATNFRAGIFNTVSWSPDGKYIVFSENDNKVRVLDISTGQISYLKAENSIAVSVVNWSPNGKYIAFEGDNAIVYIKDFSNKQTILTYSNAALITALAWSRDGKLIASADNDGKVHVWNVITRINIFNSLHYGGIVSSLAWSPTSSLLASASSDSTDTQIHIWDTTKGAPENPIQTYKRHAGGVNGITWSPDGEEIASGDGEGILRIWEVSTGNDLRMYRDDLHSVLSHSHVQVSAIAWSPNSKSIAVGHAEYDYSRQFYATVEIFTFCKLLCFF